jgi:hypothetical protein
MRNDKHRAANAPIDDCRPWSYGSLRADADPVAAGSAGDGASRREDAMITAPTGSQQFCSRTTPGLAEFRKEFSYQLLPMGGATPGVLSHRSGCSRQAAMDGQKARIARRHSHSRTKYWTQLAGKSCYQHIYRCSFRPNATVCERLAQDIQASHWPRHLSLRGTDDDVSHDCTCPNFSDSS